jgi:hypothetical protein
MTAAFLPIKLVAVSPRARRTTLAGFALLASSLTSACDPRSAAARPASAAESDSARLVREDSLARVHQDSINRARPDYVVDSILPVEEQLRRFRADLREVSRLEGGERTRQALLDAIFAGIERADTATLERLTVSPAEYAWLVYPSSPFAVPPMQQAPQVRWYMESSASDVGLARLLARLGGRPLADVHTRCPNSVVREGANSIVAGCVVRWRDGGARRALRLFGPLIERDGQWKVLSWANAF